MASCNNNFDKYTEKFQHLFKPVGTHLSLTNVHAHWDSFHKQANANPSPWFWQYFTTKIIKCHNKFCTEKLNYTKNASQDHSDKLLDLVKQCHVFHLTINHPQLPIKANITLEESSDSTHSETVALLSHTTESCSLLDSLMQKVLSLDNQVADVYKCIGELKCPAATSSNCQPKQPPQQSSPESTSHGSMSYNWHKCHTDDKTPPWLWIPKHPINGNETNLYKGETFYFCSKCLYSSSWQTNHHHNEHNAQCTKEVEAAFEKCKSWGLQRVSWAKSGLSTYLTTSSSPVCFCSCDHPCPWSWSQIPTLAVSTANLHKLHEIWKQSPQVAAAIKTSLQFVFLKTTFSAV